MDEFLNYIRMGDNVVWSVSDLEDFRYFAVPFAEQAIKDGRNLIYMRFAEHEPLLSPRPGLKICEFDPDQGFEAFTVDIYNTITREGKDAFYVFDSLSSFQSVWYTDLMMGNFFRVTCPYLFRLDTVAYFPLLRGRHSFDAVARIRDTTRLLMDVYRGEERMYLHPLKVWNRYSTRMFLPHSCPLGPPEDCSFETVDGGVAMSRYYQLVEEEDAQTQDQNYDSHDRFFALAKMEYQRGTFSRETEKQIIESTLTRDKRPQDMIGKYFLPKDYFQLRDRMIGSGSLGGKACGMLLARKIICTELPEYRECFEPHDSYYAKAYYEYPYALKPRAADAVGAVNAWYRGKGKNILFMTPGRVGTSSPELGVPVSFAQISGFRGICEVSDSRAGYIPELSYGSHMFQDLVEAGIFYCALWGDERTAAWQESLFDGLPDLFPEICPEAGKVTFW